MCFCIWIKHNFHYIIIKEHKCTVTGGILHEKNLQINIERDAVGEYARRNVYSHSA